MSSAICDGIMRQFVKVLRCPKCRKRRRHTVCERYDSFLFICRTCGVTTVSE